MDIFEVLEADKKLRAQNTLEQLGAMTMAQSSDPELYRKYATELQQQANGNTKTDKKPEFDESGFEHMRFRLKAGL